jgi:hypothetical protein
LKKCIINFQLMNKEEQRNWHVLINTVLISGAVLGILLCLISWLLTQVLGSSFKYTGSLIGALNLFVLWLVVTSSIRAIDRLTKYIPWWMFLLAGVLIVGVAIPIQEIGVLIIKRFSESMSIAGLGLRSLLFFGAIGFAIALISLIHMRVRNRLIGNVLEFAFVAGVIYLFFYFM